MPAQQAEILLFCKRKDPLFVHISIKRQFPKSNLNKSAQYSALKRKIVVFASPRLAYSSQRTCAMKEMSARLARLTK